MTNCDCTSPDARLCEEAWTEGDWRMAIGRLRSAGRHELADALEARHLQFLRHHRLLAEEGA